MVLGRVSIFLKVFFICVFHAEKLLIVVSVKAVVSQRAQNVCHHVVIVYSFWNFVRLHLGCGESRGYVWGMEVVVWAGISGVKCQKLKTKFRHYGFRFSSLAYFGI